jgi:hypothetical protein
MSAAVAALPAVGPGAGQGLALERLASLLDPAMGHPDEPRFVRVSRPREARTR